MCAPAPPCVDGPGVRRIAFCKSSGFVCTYPVQIHVYQVSKREGGCNCLSRPSLFSAAAARPGARKERGCASPDLGPHDFISESHVFQKKRIESRAFFPLLRKTEDIAPCSFTALLQILIRYNCGALRTESAGKAREVGRQERSYRRPRWMNKKAANCTSCLGSLSFSAPYLQLDRPVGCNAT